MIAAPALAAALLSGAAVTGAALPGAAAQPAPRRLLVVAFVPGEAWRADGAAVAALATGTSCAADVAVTLSAGRRARVPGCDPGARWADVRRPFDGAGGLTGPGRLATLAGLGGRCVSATGPLAELVARDLGGAVRPGPCDTHVVDLTSAPSFGAARAQAEGFGGERLLLVSVPRPGHLGGVALVPGAGLLRGSTRRDGLVALPDLHAHLTGERPLSGAGGSRADVAELARREHLHRPYHGVFHTGLIALPMLLYIALAFGRRRAGPRARRVALALAAYPVSGFLASLLPWWRPSWAAAAAVASVALAWAAAALAGLGLGRLLRAPAEVGVAAVTALVFAADLLAGGHLQETGLASYSAVAAGRFHGLGNAGFAVFATAACVALGAAAARYGPRAWLGLVPAVAVVAAPPWGADFGGAVTLTAVLVVALATRARRAAVVAGTLGGLAVALGVALLDHARSPADRTHLGRFVGDVLDGAWSGTVTRKAAAAASSLVTFYPLLVAGSAGTAYALLRRYRPPEPLLRALLVLWVLGSLVNDSGVVVAAAGLAVAGPLLVSYADRP